MDTAQILADAAWLPHRYDAASDCFRFIHVPRERQRQVTFLTDEHLDNTDAFTAVPRAAIDRAALDTAPLHFVFHSAYCCSTLVARMFDAEGLAMGLKEPVLLNDLVGWRRRGADPQKLAAVLDVSLALLARPFAPGEAVVVKPSNIVNTLAPAMLALRPEAKAILLYAPIEDFLSSIAVKGLWGRQWVRKALIGMARDNALSHPFTTEELLELTDLQAAGLGWLSSHGIFAQMRARFGEERVAICDSRTLLADRGQTVSASFRRFGMGLDDAQVAQIVGGPAFSENSKDRRSYSAADREAQLADTRRGHGEEIEMVTEWVRALARDCGLESTTDATLFA